MKTDPASNPAREATMAEAKREHREAAVVARYPGSGIPASDSWAHEWIEGRFTDFGSDETSLNAIAQALADAEQRGYARGVAGGAERERAPCSCHSCEVLPELHEQIAQMCEYLGSKREEVPCDSWHLRDIITKLKAEVLALRGNYRTQGLALAKVIGERECARHDFEALNDAAADLVAEAVGPYDPPQRGSNLEKLYRLTQAPMGWKKAGESE